MVLLAFILLFFINAYTVGKRSSTDHIVYIDGLKYRLDKTYKIKVKLDSPNMVCRHVTYRDGELIIEREFVWDGVTGMWINEAAAMRGSLVHDAIYHLMRECKMDVKNEEIADDLLVKIVQEDGVSWTLAQVFKYGSRFFRNYAVKDKYLYDSDGSQRKVSQHAVYI